MKKALFCTALLLSVSICGWAQKQGPAPAGPPSKDPGKSKTTEQAFVLESGTRLEGQLQSTLDAKTARVSDQVVLKTTKAVKQNGNIVVPKGTSLIGRVTDVQQRTKSSSGSRIGVIFDRLQGRGLETPINASIVSITQAAAASRMTDTDADIFGSSSTSARASGRGNTGGGGLLGGGTGVVGGVVNTAGQVAGPVLNTTGAVVNTAGQTTGNIAGGIISTVNGIQISNSASGSAQTSSTLSAQGKNIRVEKGANVALQLNTSISMERGQ